MADALKIVQKWKKKTTKGGITIGGKTLADALKALNKLPKKEWARFHHTGKSDGKPDAKVTEVTLTLTYDIQMPSWSGYGKASKAAQKEWDRMWAALLKHEDGHVKVFTDSVKGYVKSLDKAARKGLSKAALGKLHKKWWATLQQQHKDYDKRTKNGRGQHVTLNPAKGIDVSGPFG